MKLPKHYFCLNDMTPGFEVEECIIQECESAGLEITENEDLAEERGYDKAFEVINPYKDKKAIGRECPAYKQDGECGSCRACWSRKVKQVSYKEH